MAFISAVPVFIAMRAFLLPVEDFRFIANKAPFLLENFNRTNIHEKNV